LSRRSRRVNSPGLRASASKNVNMKTVTFLLLILFGISTLNAQTIQRETDFNFNWKFTLVESTDLPSQLPLDDSNWRDVRLPHDWSVEFPFSDEWEGCTGYLPGGVGIYQKHFKTPASPKEKSVFVKFDGVYNNATFWLNGKLLGENPYGYSPVNWDLTPHLKTDGSDNVLTVHVDHSRYADSRWYTGSGIYRNVKLVTVDKLHIPIWGTFITTPEVDENEAKVQLKIKVKNQTGNSNFTLETKLVDNNGNVVAKQIDELKLGKNSEEEFTQNFSVTKPNLWDCENPNMYKAITTISKKGEVVDEYITPFGIRSIEFVANKGFSLNGKSTFMKGVCLHHDAGLVGAAVPEGVWRRRLQALKDGGVNAIRGSHNPVSEEFLDLCDEMGFLVQNEIFDELDYPKDKRLNLHERHDDYLSRGYTEHFQEWAKSDLERTVLRDRNHPSVVQWSIGNEIEWTYLSYRYVTGFWTDPEDPTKSSGNFWGDRPMFSADEMRERYESMDKEEYVLGETSQCIADWIRELDTSRPTTANHIIPQVSHVSGYADAVDIAGYSYRNNIFPWSKYYFPNKQTTINECPGTWDDWIQVLEYPGVFSIFMWTGIDYLGESHERWPGRRPWGDMLDLAGFKVQGWNYFKSIWVDDPHLSIGTLPLEGSGFGVDKMSGFALADSEKSFRWRDSEMHWNYKVGDTLLVEVCSNYSTVELLLNGKSLGFRSMSESPDRLMRWVVPFEAGKLEARAVLGSEKTKTALVTASEPVKMELSSDKSSLIADAYDVAHLVVQLVDKNGNAVLTENTTVEFELEGPAKLLGVDCANHHKHQEFQSNNIETYKGRCLAIIQSTKEAGTVKITAKANGFEGQAVVLQMK